MQRMCEKYNYYFFQLKRKDIKSFDFHNINEVQWVTEFIKCEELLTADISLQKTLKVMIYV